MPPLEILYEDNHLLVVNKPAGVATMGAPAGAATLLARAKDYIRHRCAKPGNVYLGVMSRLDAPVTGVVLFARTSKAAARMTEQFRTHSVEKLYWALVEGEIDPASRRVSRLALPRRAASPRANRRAGRGGGEASEPPLPATVAERRGVAAGGRVGHGAKAPDSRAVGPLRPSCRRRPEIRERSAIRRGHRLARAAIGDRTSSPRRAARFRGAVAAVLGRIWPSRLNWRPGEKPEDGPSFAAKSPVDAATPTAPRKSTQPLRTLTLLRFFLFRGNVKVVPGDPQDAW